MNSTVLDIRGLHVSFPGLAESVQAVRGCSLALETGEVVGLVGESGCGKSVTALACLGLLPTPAEVSGSIEVAGRQVVGRPDRELEQLRGAVVAMVFQNPMAALNPFFTVGQQLSAPIRRHRALPRSQARHVALEALHDVRVPDPELTLARYPHQLSGGQLQRVMIAMAVACRPRVLIADEPTTALDVTVQAQIIVLLRELAQRERLSVLFITHDLGVVAALCDRVAVMYAGTVVEAAPVARLFARPTHPYTVKLLETVPARGRTGTSLAAIPGQIPNMARPPAGCAFHPRCPRATAVCNVETPAVREVGDGHRTACHHIDALVHDDSLGGREAG